MRLRDEILNLLAIYGEPIPKSAVAKVFDGKNIYTESCLPTLKKAGAIKETAITGEISLQSLLLRSAILLHIAQSSGLRTHAAKLQSEAKKAMSLTVSGR